MKRITRLTESDLMRIIKRVINEQEDEDDDIQTWMDFNKKYPMPSRDETDDVQMDKTMKRINVFDKNPKLVSRLDDDKKKTNTIKILQNQLSGIETKLSQVKYELSNLEGARNRIMAKLNDLGYNP